jgi:hypothetical protein
MATRPHIWQLVQVDDEGGREVIGLHATTADTPPQPDGEITVDDVTVPRSRDPARQ